MDAVDKRSEQRAGRAVQIRSLDTQDPARARGSVGDRLREVDRLSADCWRLAQKPLPDYRRSESPIRILPMGDGAAAPS